MKAYDLCIVGAGSGGIGAAITAAKLGLKTLLLEKNPEIGGTAVWGGVNTWEMSVGGTGVPYDIYCRLKEIPNAVGVYSCGRHFSWQDNFYWPNELDKVNFPGGENVMDPTKRYLDTLRRHPGDHQKNETFCREFWHGVTFEPERLVQVVRDMLTATGNCEIRAGIQLADVTVEDGAVKAVTLSDGESIEADYWIDGTGDGTLCVKAGCDYYSGLDPKARFDEPGAPEEPTDRLNGATLIYRVTPVERPAVEMLPDGVPETCWWSANFPAMCCNHYPNGDRNCNMLPTMDGREFASLRYEDAYRECSKRVHAHWHFVQTHFPEFRGFRLHWVAPMIGIRETNRIVAEYMLNENDLNQGLSGQSHPDIIAINDHAADRHGAGGGCPEVPEPHGIPYRSLIPKGMKNLLVACRSAGFSSIAASSCRLSRIMMQLGQAAGNAVYLAADEGIPVIGVDPDQLRLRLVRQRVQLEWPLPTAIRDQLTQ